MDFTILAVVLLIGIGIPVRNKLIRKYREEKKQKCKSECLIDIEQFHITVIKAPDAQPQSR